MSASVSDSNSTFVSVAVSILVLFRFPPRVPSQLPSGWCRLKGPPPARDDTTRIIIKNVKQKKEKKCQLHQYQKPTSEPPQSNIMITTKTKITKNTPNQTKQKKTVLGPKTDQTNQSPCLHKKTPLDTARAPITQERASTPNNPPTRLTTRQPNTLHQDGGGGGCLVSFPYLLFAQARGGEWERGRGSAVPTLSHIAAAAATTVNY